MNLSERVALRYAASITAAEFAQGFFQRHPRLGRFTPHHVLDKSGGGGSHPEARQAGDDVWLFPKFWKLEARTQDFVFAHELGHLVLSRHGTQKLIDELAKHGVDAWDASALPFGQFNMEEAFADCFASYFLEPADLKKYPAWEAIVRHLT